eukprot:9196661-Ditylum_brightwellii.AAC.1
MALCMDGMSCTSVIVPKLDAQLLMLRCPKANVENSLFGILEKVEAIIGTVDGDGKADGNF